MTRSAWCLIVWIALWSGWTSPPIKQVAVAVDVQDQAIFRDPLVVLDRPGRAGDRQADALVVVLAAEVDHQHEEGDQLEDDVEQRRQVRLGLELAAASRPAIGITSRVAMAWLRPA